MTQGRRRGAAVRPGATASCSHVGVPDCVARATRGWPDRDRGAISPLPCVDQAEQTASIVAGQRSDVPCTLELSRVLPSGRASAQSVYGAILTSRLEPPLALTSLRVGCATQAGTFLRLYQHELGGFLTCKGSDKAVASKSVAVPVQFKVRWRVMAPKASRLTPTCAPRSRLARSTRAHQTRCGKSSCTTPRKARLCRLATSCASGTSRACTCV